MHGARHRQRLPDYHNRRAQQLQVCKLTRRAQPRIQCAYVRLVRDAEIQLEHEAERVAPNAGAKDPPGRAVKKVDRCHPRPHVQDCLERRVRERAEVHFGVGFTEDERDEREEQRRAEPDEAYVALGEAP